MWLKIIYDEADIADWQKNSQNISVTVEYSSEVTIGTEEKTFRVSPIFPLSNNNAQFQLKDYSIHFFSLPNAYSALGRIEKAGSKSLKEATFFSLGLCSVILMTDDDNLLEEFKGIIGQVEIAYEHWLVKDGKLHQAKYHIKEAEVTSSHPDLKTSYGSLEVTERAVIDEFRINIKLLVIKLNLHMVEEQAKINILVDDIDSMVKEIVYLHNPTGNVPATLSEYSPKDLKDIRLKTLITQQNLDLIIQVNSALSYVATQAFSGAIPILERRSLIRRNSLLGIGSAILALNRVTRFIEKSFSLISFEKVITEYMNIAAPLPGLDNFPFHDSSEWNTFSVNEYAAKAGAGQSYSKLSYFSGRLGFRETRYSIAAALQSVTSGANLDWSLLTLTHEMLHGHVREIIDCIFYGEDREKPEDVHALIYQQFADKILKHNKYPEKQIDTIRRILLSYCTLTLTQGSLTQKPTQQLESELRLLQEKKLWTLFSRENRNINEIFVHVLDLHYFYASRISIYIPLIWCSWLSVPHINGDIRQYILRSLLAIASTIKQSPHKRFKACVEIFKEILLKHSEGRLKSPVIEDVLSILNDDIILQKEYFPSFNASLCIVDLVKEVFYCSIIRAALFDDEFVEWKKNEQDEDEIENQFIYNLQDGFNDETIKAPLSYLLYRMIKTLNSNATFDIERETTLQFLALNSSQ